MFVVFQQRLAVSQYNGQFVTEHAIGKKPNNCDNSVTPNGPSNSYHLQIRITKIVHDETPLYIDNPRLAAVHYSSCTVSAT